jgi:hypothetical protein
VAFQGEAAWLPIKSVDVVPSSVSPASFAVMW